MCRLAFDAARCRVLLSCLPPLPLAPAPGIVGPVALLRERFGDEIVAVQGDVTRYADNQRAVDATLARFGKLDCFIGNAAVWDHAASLTGLSAEQLDQGFDELFARFFEKMHGRTLTPEETAALAQLRQEAGL